MAYLWQWCPFYLCGHLTSPVPVIIQVLGQKCAKWLVNCDLCVPVCTFVLWRTWLVSSSISSWGCDSVAQDHSNTLPYTSCGVCGCLSRPSASPITASRVLVTWSVSVSRCELELWVCFWTLYWLVEYWKSCEGVCVMCWNLNQRYWNC